MANHFTLDVHPEVLRAAADRIGEMGALLTRRSGRVRSAPTEWRDNWQGGASTVIGEEAVNFSDHLTRWGTRLDGAATAVRSYAGDLEQAVTVDLVDLNRRWAAAEAAYDQAVRDADAARDQALRNLGSDVTPQQRRMIRMDLDDARSGSIGVAYGALRSEQEKLEGEYDALRARLERRTRALGDALAQETAIPVPPALVSAYSQGGFLRSGARWVLDNLLDDAAQDGLGGPLADLRSALEDPPDDYEEVTALLERARALGVPPDQYADVLERYWQFRAAEAAGIDLSQWDPGKGADHNRAIIEAVYRYYGDLYLANPDLQWAGMANMIGPSFAAGFFDLDLFRGFAEDLSDIPWPLDTALPPGLELIAGLTAEDLEFYETRFLDMQRQIFFDQATMHQAYVDGDMAAIRELEAAGLIDADIADAWADIDSGDPVRVQQANELFLWREQFDIIQDDYQAMYDHDPTGPALTWLMTQIGTPSIPGAQGYADVDPLTITVDTPGPDDVGTPSSIFGVDIPHVSVDNPLEGSVDVETPFAGGNIAHFDDRWRLIEEDTLPAYQRLLAEDPDRARELIAADVGARIGDYRLQHQIDDILWQLTDWNFDFDQ